MQVIKIKKTNACVLDPGKATGGKTTIFRLIVSSTCKFNFQNQHLSQTIFFTSVI